MHADVCVHIGTPALPLYAEIFVEGFILNFVSIFVSMWVTMDLLVFKKFGDSAFSNSALAGRV